MRSFSLRITCLALILGLSISCKNKNTEEEPSAQELALEELAYTWSVNNGSVIRDGLDVSANYPGMQVTISAGNYTTINAGDLFAASGTWDWVGESTTRLTLDDGKTVTIGTVNETTLVISFDHTGTGGAAFGVSGSYQITLTR